ncbi:unnamed protein product [Symbiodinium pilosum]|uniref:Uncharacterized protein n=1 Tax=Symbiodinium pilosum TaxID=2952 RepID=A0A812WUE9_SYMPI|nr:unnamed protein product [Symbiodinium pilosum]
MLQFEAKLGSVSATADSSGNCGVSYSHDDGSVSISMDSKSEILASADAGLDLVESDGSAEVDMALGHGWHASVGVDLHHSTAAKATWSSDDGFGLTTKSLTKLKVSGHLSKEGGISVFSSPEDLAERGLVSGHVDLDAAGNVVSGDLQFDVAAIADLFNNSQDLSVEQLQVRWGEHLMEGRITVNGVDVSLKYQEFNVSGSTETSRVEYGEDGSICHYYGETEVREGTVEQISLGLGCHVPGTGAAASVKGEAAILSNNDYTSHKDTQSFDRCGNSTTETFTSEDTTDKSTQVFGAKVGGTTETIRKETTINTEKQDGTFISSTKKTTTEEEAHLKEHHNFFSDDVEILHESKLQVEELEYQLIQAGFALAILIMPAVAVYMADGKLSTEELLKIAFQTVAASAAMAAFSRAVGSQNAVMAVILLATILPDLAHGRTDEVKKRLEKLMFSVLMSAAANRGTQFVFGLTALAPFAPILGPAAGMCASSVADSFG